MCHIYQKHFLGVWWYHRSKDFEAMKVGKLAIQPWLSCLYYEHAIMDLPYSMVQECEIDFLRYLSYSISKRKAQVIYYHL